MALADWTDIVSSGNSITIYGGFNPLWAAGRLERLIVDNIAFEYQSKHPNQTIFFAVPTWHEPIDILKESNKYNPDLTVLFSLTDPLGPIEKLIDQFTNPVDIVGYTSSQDKFIDFWAIACHKFFKKYTIEELIPQEDFSHVFLNYNRKPHQHRIQLIKQFEENNLVSAGCVTLGNSKYTLNEHTVDFSKWGADDVVGELNIPNDIYSLGNLNIWNSSFLNVVSETEYQYNHNVFISEKIFKPIIGLRPFVLNGSPGIYTVLKNAGFDCFDDIFPVNKLSDTNNAIQFATHQTIIEIIQDLKKENLEKLYQKLLPRLIDNQQAFFKYGKSQESRAALTLSI